MTVGRKKKDAQNPPVLIEDPTPEVKEIMKSPSSFSFENEVQKIKIPVPFLEPIKIKELRKYLSNELFLKFSSKTIDSLILKMTRQRSSDRR
jgi:hypothetical protein